MIDESDEALKPCPFCGCKNVKLESDPRAQVTFVECPPSYKGGCGASGGIGTEKWNRRALDDPSVEELRARAAVLDHKLSPSMVRCLVARLLAHVSSTEQSDIVFMTAGVCRLPDELIEKVIDELPRVGEKGQDWAPDLPPGEGYAALARETR